MNLMALLPEEGWCANFRGLFHRAEAVSFCLIQASETKGSMNAPPWKRGLRFSSSLGPESTSIRECGEALFFFFLASLKGTSCFVTQLWPRGCKPKSGRSLWESVFSSHCLEPGCDFRSCSGHFVTMRQKLRAFQGVNPLLDLN